MTAANQWPVFGCLGRWICAYILIRVIIMEMGWGYGATAIWRARSAQFLRRTRRLNPLVAFRLTYLQGCSPPPGTIALASTCIGRRTGITATKVRYITIDLCSRIKRTVWQEPSSKSTWHYKRRQRRISENKWGSKRISSSMPPSLPSHDSKAARAGHLKLLNSQSWLLYMSVLHMKTGSLLVDRKRALLLKDPGYPNKAVEVTSAEGFSR